MKTLKSIGKLAADANPMFSAIIGGKARDVFQSFQNTAFYTTEFNFKEVEKYIPVMSAKRESGVIAKRVKAILQVNVEKELQECKVPILYIESTKDHMIKHQNVRKIISLRNDVRVVRIDTSHFVLQLAPCEAVKEIEKFVSDIIPST